MEMQEFIKKFAEVFEETDAEVFTPETKFRELEEWSSFLALSVMAMCGDEYDVNLSAQEMREAQTVQDVYNAVAAKQ